MYACVCIHAYMYVFWGGMHTFHGRMRIEKNCKSKQGTTSESALCKHPQSSRHRFILSPSVSLLFLLLLFFCFPFLFPFVSIVFFSFCFLSFNFSFTFLYFPFLSSPLFLFFFFRFLFSFSSLFFSFLFCPVSCFLFIKARARSHQGTSISIRREAGNRLLPSLNPSLLNPRVMCGGVALNEQITCFPTSGRLVITDGQAGKTVANT